MLPVRFLTIENNKLLIYRLVCTSCYEIIYYLPGKPDCSTMAMAAAAVVVAVVAAVMLALLAPMLVGFPLPMMAAAVTWAGKRAWQWNALLFSRCG